MANDFCFLNLLTHDPAKARDFYGALFDWQMEATEAGGVPITIVSPGASLPRKDRGAYLPQARHRTDQANDADADRRWPGPQG